MKARPLAIPEVLLVEPQRFSDDRGWFMETYSQKKMCSIGIDAEFVQDNHSFSRKAGTVRGLHFQKVPHAQAKLVRCTRGAIRDVAVDLRTGSPTHLKWVAAELSAENTLMLFVPRGFAHGFITLCDDVEVEYKVDSHYAKESDRGIRFDDPAIAVDWDWDDEFHLSEKDSKAPLLKDVDCEFGYEVPL